MRRIVSLLPSATESLFLLGCGEQVVGVSHECNFPLDAATLPRVTRSNIDSETASADIDRQVKSALSQDSPLYVVDEDQIDELSPALIVTQSQCDVCAIKLDDVRRMIAARPSLAHCELLTLAPTSLADVFTDIERIGRAAGLTDEQIAGGLGELTRRGERIIELVEPRRRTPRVAVVEWIEPLMIAGNWTPELMTLAGGEYGLADAGSHSPYRRWEEVAAFDPEVLIIAPCGFDLERAEKEARSLRENAVFRELSCHRSGAVYLMDGDAYLNRSGPRLVDTVEIAAHLLHPQLAPRKHSDAWRPFDAPLD